MTKLVLPRTPPGSAADRSTGGPARLSGVDFSGVLREAQALAAGPRGVDDVAELLARHTGCDVRLFDERGQVHCDISGGSGGGEHRRAGGAVAELLADGTRCVIIQSQQRYEQLLAIDGLGDGPSGRAVLEIVATHDLPAPTRAFVADIAHLVSLAWQLRSAHRAHCRAAENDAATARSILRLLLGHQAAAARGFAADRGITLPDRVTVIAVHHPGVAARTVVAEIAPELAVHEVWAAPGTPDEDQTVILLPARNGDCAYDDRGSDQSAARGVDRVNTTHDADADADADADWHTDPTTRRTIELLHERYPECAVGASPTHTLERAGIAHQQALQALSVAQHDPRRSVRFDNQLDLAALLAHQAQPWARHLLAPLMTYRPTRRSQPDTSELVVSLSALLHSPHSAHEDLHVHRNTLIGRRRLLQRMLNADLTRFPTRAALSFALRVAATPTRPDPLLAAPTPGTAPPPRLEDLTALPQALAWSRMRLRPLRDLPQEAGTTTLETWLSHGARFAPTAHRLGITDPGVRKRLTRIEAALGIPLTHKPANQYDLWLAFRALRADTDA